VDGPGASVDAEALPEQAEAAVGEAAVGEDGA
jgi:hypothetical protein